MVYHIIFAQSEEKSVDARRAKKRVRPHSAFLLVRP
jgi:hypothetical protein